MHKYILSILILTFIIYANTLTNGFVSDDLPTIVDNPEIARPLAAGWFIPTISNSLNYLAGGLNPFGYHLVNILLHGLNAVLVFFLLRLFFRPLASFFGALIFAAHPVQSEAVAWVSGRLSLFMTFFLLSSFLLYRDASKPNRGTFLKSITDVSLPKYAASLLFFILAVLSSWSFALFFPLMIVIYDVTFGRWRRCWRLWPAFFIVAGVKLFLLATRIESRVVEVARDVGTTAWSNPLFNMSYSFFKHLWLILWPEKLTLYHEPMVISRRLLNLEIFVLALLVLALPFIFRKAKPLFFALCIYVLFLVPTYSPVMIAWLVAERYLYFPMVAFCIFGAFLLERFTPPEAPPQ